MKTVTCCIVVLVLGFTSACTSRQSLTSNSTPQEITEVVIGSQSEIPPLLSLNMEDKNFAGYLADYYQLDAQQVESGMIWFAEGAQASEIAVLVMKEAGDAAAAESKLREYLTERTWVFAGYAPQQAAMVKNGIVLVEGRHVALFICQDTARAKAAFLSSFKNNRTRPPVSRNMDTGRAVAKENEASPFLMKAAYQIPYNAAEKNAISPFLMKADSQAPMAKDVYDATSVLRAWQTGDISSLSDMNLRIFTSAKDVIARIIRNDMSDYEKELAIHDWMVGWSSFDMDAFGRVAADRAEADNQNPYGFLINRSAMCHGYSSTFQLFMDMLNIECITVFGTPLRNGVRHSWNMVRLNGEWYCVDVAWDDPIGGGLTHTYFNVTSARLREGSIHRWDSTSVPEATGTAFRYR